MNTSLNAVSVMQSEAMRLAELGEHGRSDRLIAASNAIDYLIGYMKQIRIEATESPQTDADRLTAIAAMACAAIARAGGAA